MAKASGTEKSITSEVGRTVQIAIVIVALIGNFMMSSFVVSFNVLLTSVSASLHMADANARLIGSLAAMGMALGALPCGFLLDRFSAISVMAGAATLTAIAYAALAIAGSPVIFGGIAILAICLPSTALGMASATKLILGTVGTRQGIRLAIAAAGVSAGGIILPPFAAWSSEIAGWRSTFAALSLVAALFVIPLLFLRRHVNPIAVGTQKLPVSVVKFFVQQPAFWIIVIVAGLANGIGIAVGLTSISHAMKLGIPLIDASLLLSVAALAGLVATPAWGALFDKFDPGKLLSSALMLCGLALGIFILTKEYSVMLASFGIFGFAYSALLPAQSLLLRRSFGTELLGRAFGFTALAMLPFVGAPTFYVVSLANLGSTAHYLGFVIGYSTIALLLLALRGPKKHPVRRPFRWG
ncbi:MFS transporter [Sphingobium mellinum]|uniref:MFS transporter n=1 Tax=Sphingobium mellinum TaxID=1387166 RepID=UPI0030EDE31A